MSKKNKKLNHEPTPESTDYSKDKTPVIFQRNKLKSALNIFKRSDLTPRQKEFLELASNKEVKMIFVSGPAGTSKAQPLDAELIGESGIIQMGNVKIGDMIFGEDGISHKVISIHPQGIKDIYKITFSDDTSTESTLEHLWLTQTEKDRNQRIKIKGKRYWTNPKNGTVKTTAEIINSLKLRNGTRLNHSIPITAPVKFSSKSHIISPYILGALLGDGCFRVPGYVRFTSADDEIIKKIENELPSNIIINKIPSAIYEYSIIHKNKSESLNNGNYIKNEIKRFNLDMIKSDSKFIPNDYLFDSIENRIDLLRGLMDTDGTVGKRSGTETSYTTTSQQLANNIRFLIESLGGVCRINKYKNHYTYLTEEIQGLDYYNISVCMPPHINPFFLKRKADLLVPKTKYKPIRYITNIELVGKKECQCILVDNTSHLYLTNNFIVTHNTYLSIMAALQLLSDKKVSDIIYARSIVECSDKSMGALPGTVDDKVHVYLQPLIDKLEELLPKHEIEMLNKDKRISGIPISFLRGLNFNAKAIIGDEFQNCTYKEILTFITRTGEFSKVFILGDVGQSDINGKSGFEKMMNLFDGENHRKKGIYVFRFTIEDCVRSGLVKHILETIEADKLKNPK